MSKESDDPDKTANAAGEASPTDSEKRARRILAMAAIIGFGSFALGAGNVTLGNYLGLQGVLAKLLLNFALTAAIFGPALFWFSKKRW